MQNPEIVRQCADDVLNDKDTLQLSLSNTTTAVKERVVWIDSTLVAGSDTDDFILDSS